MPSKLIPPGTRKGNKFFLLRGCIHGREFEVSTRCEDIVLAEDFRIRFERDFAVYAKSTVGKRSNLRHADDDMEPEAMPLTSFHHHLLDQFILIDGEVCQRDGRSVGSNRSGDGYRHVIVNFGRRSRYISLHRLVFLLANRWLPRLIDHIDRNRFNNHPDNLRASSPYLNAQNRRDSAGKQVGDTENKA